MAFDAFLKIPSIAGESNDEKHKDWIEITSFGYGVSNPVSTRAGKSERASHQDFSIIKATDKASPHLFLACCDSRKLNEMRIELCRATQDKQKYMEIKLYNAYVTSYQPNGETSGKENLPTETVTFNYQKIEFIYTETDRKTGRPKGDLTAYWDLARNAGG